ncbi:DUF6415 family natural product biosynthesis protein [Streptomyces celluloflavus]|uniref:DUF6415 family natural product biosynthesis protein n=1 Tax=Streptomyces celluloflavus TaxID=58344 RepID=UPI00345FB82A|nr:DUF6415 family natural product biosynthesis protein [Streptomyces celluloflavus]
MTTSLPRPSETWKPPLDAEALTRVLDHLLGWTPLDSEALLDDVADAQDDLPPGREEMPDLVQRLNAHLKRLEDIAITSEASQRDAYVANLVERGATLRAAAVPGEFEQAKGHMRRISWIVSELVDRLVATKCLKEAA